MEQKAVVEVAKNCAPRPRPSPSNVVRRHPHLVAAGPGKVTAPTTLIVAFIKEIRLHANFGYPMMIGGAMLLRKGPRHPRQGMATWPRLPLIVVHHSKSRIGATNTMRKINRSQMLPPRQK